MDPCILTYGLLLEMKIDPCLLVICVSIIIKEACKVFLLMFCHCNLFFYNFGHRGHGYSFVALYLVL